MRTSENIADILAALAKAQGEFTNPDRNREVKVKTRGDGEYSFSYATFDAIVEMARPILTKHSLAFVQSPETHEGDVSVTTRIGHQSGQWIESTLSVAAAGGPQQIGSAITYLKRYSLCAMLGIASEEDDDGNAASGNEITGSQTKGPREVCPKCGKPGFKDKEKENAFYCWKKKEGCGHTWVKGEAEPPKTNGKPAGDPFEAAKSAVAKCEKERFGTLIDDIQRGTRSTPEQKEQLLELLAQRVTNSLDDGNDQATVDGLLAKILVVRKEVTHTFAQ